MTDELSELYQQVILDHSRNPRHCHALPDANRVAEGDNPLCGDHYTVYLKIQDGVILDVGFQGAGCAISKSSASMMADAIKGKTEAEARQLFSQYQNMVTTGGTTGPDMGKLLAFAGVHNFPMRVKCAILPWRAMLAGLDGQTAASTDAQ